MTDQAWETGTSVRFRYVRDGRAFWTLPARVVRDDSEELVLWIAPGSEMLRPPQRVTAENLAAGRWNQQRSEWTGPGVLMRRTPREAGHAVWLFWTDGAERTFRGWYVNLEKWSRDVRGVDAFDQVLDIWVNADGRWEWKDEDELADCVDAGVFSVRDAGRIRGEGQRVLDAWPFPTGWEEWEPDPTWAAPRLAEVDGDAAV
jgi:hypothetical protein